MGAISQKGAEFLIRSRLADAENAATSMPCSSLASLIRRAAAERRST